jgi:hypothetical protein
MPVEPVITIGSFVGKTWPCRTADHHFHVRFHLGWSGHFPI